MTKPVHHVNETDSRIGHPRDPTFQSPCPPSIITVLELEPRKALQDSIPCSNEIQSPHIFICLSLGVVKLDWWILINGVLGTWPSALSPVLLAATSMCMMSVTVCQAVVAVLARSRLWAVPVMISMIVIVRLGVVNVVGSLVLKRTAV